MKCEFGFCLHCEKEITDNCPHCNSRKPNQNYTEVCLKLSNGSKIFVAVCVDCKDAVFTADKQQIIEAIKEGWRKEASKHGRANEVGYIQNLEESWKDLRVID